MSNVDEKLLAASLNGDPQAFATLHQKYRNRIVKYIYRMLKDHDRSVDLAQETFVRIYINDKPLPQSVSFSTYLYRIARGLAIDELRRRDFRNKIRLPDIF